MDTKKAVPGALLVVVGAAVLFWGATVASVPQYGLVVAALALAAGTLLVGTSSVDQNRNV